MIEQHQAEARTPLDEKVERKLAQLQMPDTIGMLPKDELDLLQPKDMLERFVHNWLDKGRDQQLLNKIITELRIVSKEQFTSSLRDIAARIIRQSEQGPTVVATAFVGESGGKIAGSDFFAPVMERVNDGRIIGFAKESDDVKDLAAQIPDGATVMIYDDASYSGAHLRSAVAEFKKLGKNLRIVVLAAVVTRKSLTKLYELGVDEVIATYKMPTPADIFNNEDHQKLVEYYGYDDVDEMWTGGIYGAISHKVPDNFFKPFNFASEIYYTDDGQADSLMLLNTHGLNKSRRGQKRLGEDGIYNN
jgi:hypothetical protein